VSVKRKGNSSNFEATAKVNDNVGVVKVEFFLDNTLQGYPLLVAPWKMNITIYNAGTHAVSIRVYDAAGNVGTSSASVQR
jgi:hypothetical protein